MYNVRYLHRFCVVKSIWNIIIGVDVYCFCVVLTQLHVHCDTEQLTLLFLWKDLCSEDEEEIGPVCIPQVRTHDQNFLKFKIIVHYSEMADAINSYIRVNLTRMNGSWTVRKLTVEMYTSVSVHCPYVSAPQYTNCTGMGSISVGTMLSGRQSYLCPSENGVVTVNSLIYMCNFSWASIKTSEVWPLW